MPSADPAVRTEVYCCSTLLSLVTAVVAGGLDQPAADGVRRLLLVADYAAEAETGRPLPERAGTAVLADLFDEVVDLNALLAPHHPGGWTPGEQALGLLRTLLTERWGLGPDLHLVVEPYQVNFARWLLQLFPDAPVTVVADGLMAYGPTRQRVPSLVGRRVVELAHLDLVPGLTPVYLSEHGVPARPLAPARVRAVLDRVAATSGAGAAAVGDQAEGAPGAVVLGQYLSALGILTEDEEELLYVDAAVRAAERCGGVVGFKPHPAASPLAALGVQRAAAARGVAVQVLEGTGPAEALFASGRCTAVYGCFSTGLFTARALYGLPAVAVGTELLLQRLTPYQNSNRVPVVLADLLLRADDPAPAADPPDPAVVDDLVRSTAYCMRPAIYPELRPLAVRTWTAHPRWRDRYVRRRRLTALALPGARPEPLAAPLRLRVRRRLVRAARRVSAPLAR